MNVGRSSGCRSMGGICCPTGPGGAKDKRGRSLSLLDGA